MFLKHILYSQSKETGIERTVIGEFKDQTLIIFGFDVGESLIQWHGKDEFEYSITIEHPQLLLLAEVFKIQPYDRENLLATIYTLYHTSSCFEDVRKLLEENKIEFNEESYPL